jgi:hypothetical protein
MRLVGISLFLSLALGSCGPTEVGDKCLQDSNCGIGFICNHEIACTSNAECIDGFLCNPQLGGGSLCQQDDNEDGTIGDGEDNIDTPEGICALVPCDAETICPNGFSCGDTGFCERDTP